MLPSSFDTLRYWAQALQRFDTPSLPHPIALMPYKNRQGLHGKLSRLGCFLRSLIKGY